MSRYILMLVLCTCTFFVLAQPSIVFETVVLSGETLNEPVDITGSGDNSNRLFAVEKGGTIKIIDGTTILPNAFLDISDQVFDSGERGLLGLVFHPTFPDSPYCFVNYVTPENISHIARFTINPSDPNDALEDSEKTILTLAQPYSNHNGGDLAFGPDGFLYIAFGDGGSFDDPLERAQNPLLFHGKMLRIDIDTDDPYVIPFDNPFVGNPEVLDEIWALGLRNPWRFSFDSETDELWIADVGQDLWEEVNIQPAASPGGQNYGWDCFEGNNSFENNCDAFHGILTYPDFEYPHDYNVPQGWELGFGNSVTGGFVYRGSQYPGLQGIYICADYVTNYYWLIYPSANNLGLNTQAVDGTGDITEVVSFGEADDKEIYMLEFNGTLKKVTTDEILDISSIEFRAQKSDLAVDLQWQYKNDYQQNILLCTIERSTLGTPFTALAHIEIDPDRDYYQFTDARPHNGKNLYRLLFEKKDGTDEYSNILNLNMYSANLFSIDQSTESTKLSISFAASDLSCVVEVVSEDGKVVWKKSLNNLQTALTESIDMSSYGSGLYFIRASNGLNQQLEKIVIVR